jgi:mRNA interferase MazF
MAKKPMKRFDVWLVMKNPEHGRVVDNLGLCTIVTPDELNDLPSLMVAPMTTSSEELPSRVECQFEGSKGYIMVDQIRSVEKFCFIKKLGKLELSVQVNLCDCLQEFFAL